MVGFIITSYIIWAYVGYRMELSGIAVSEVASDSKKIFINRPVNGPLLALKALGIRSILSIGGVGLLTAAVFRAHGCLALQELLMTWREWAPRKRKELFEDSWGIFPQSTKHENVIATRGFSEDEEWGYINKKYIPELVDKSNGR